MFVARRLNPAVPEHKVFIDAEIAKLKVLEPKDAVGYEEFYQKRMDEYLASHPVESSPKEEKSATVKPPVPADSPVNESEAVVPGKPKRGRKKKVL